MATNDMPNKETLKTTIEQSLNQYLNSFLQRNNQNKCSEELIIGMGNIIITELMKALEPLIKDENKGEK